MYIERVPANLLPGQRVRIKYDCDGGFKLCGTESTPIYSVAKKNADAHGGKHVCRSCQMAANNPAKRKEVREKIEKTNIEKYGTAMPINTPEKITERVEKMFGTEESTQKIVSKRRETSVKRYGADHIMKTDEGIRRLNEAMQERYGVDFPLQSEEVQEKMRQTCQERYGVDNPLSLPEIRVKGAITTLEKYGVEHYNQLPEMKDYLRQNCTTWLAESYANPWAKGITRPEEWNQKQRETVARSMAEGTWMGGGKHSLRGIYRSDKCKKKVAIFRSSYELKTHWQLDNDPNVEWYDYEPFQVVYLDTEGKSRYYTIDFVVKYKDRGRLKAIEVKNNFTKESEMTKNKYEAFMEHCGAEMDHEFWLNEKIEKMQLDLKKLLTSDRVSLLEKPGLDQ